MTSFLELQNISVSLGGRPLLQGVTLSVAQSSWMFLLGANGSGKTTLLRLIAGQLVGWQGTLIVQGRSYTAVTWNPVEAYKQGIVMVEQLPVLPEEVVAWEYLLWGLPYAGSALWLSEKTALAQIKNQLALEGHFSFDLAQKIGNLSQSDRFRLCVASALLRARSLILWDESTIFLGHEEKSFLPELITRLKSQSIATLMVTHENLPWMRGADHLTFLKEGRCVPIAPEEVTSCVIHYAARDWISSSAVRKEELLKVELADSFIVSVQRSEVVSLVADSEIPLREWEGLIMGTTSTLQGTVSLERQDLTFLSFQVRRTRIGYLATALGGRGEKTLFSFALPFLFDRTLSRVNSLLLQDKEVEAFAQEKVPLSLWSRLRTPWRFLSGGEKQGIILSRELAREPHFLLAAFPSQGLDKEAVEFFYEKIHAFTRKTGAGVLILTTERAEAETFSHRVYDLSGRGFLEEAL